MKTKDNNGRKYSNKKFLIAFCVFIGLSALVRHLFFETPVEKEKTTQETVTPVQQIAENDTSTTFEEYNEDPIVTQEFNIEQKTKIKGVLSFTDDFPDANDVQIIAAQANGITPLESREELKQHLDAHRLVYIGASPYFVVDDLSHSVPYLTPKTYQLVNTIALNFIDSLISKGQQPHLLMVTSALRTQDDVSRLQKGNGNSISNSAHCYGTTVDITYNRFITIMPDKTMPILVDRYDFKKKQVLSEVLRDLRAEGRCFVKYERNQACFHLTIKN